MNKPITDTSKHMNIFKRRLYDWHDRKRMTLGSIPGGPTGKANKLIRYHEAEMLKLTEKDS